MNYTVQVQYPWQQDQPIPVLITVGDGGQSSRGTMEFQHTHWCFKKSDRFRGRWERAFIFNTGKNHRMIVHLNTPPLSSSSSLGGFTLTQPCHHKGHLNTHLHTLAHWHDRCRPQRTSLTGVSQSWRCRARFMIWKPDNTGTKNYCLCTFFLPNVFTWVSCFRKET